jgi:hypothetical protein
MQEEMMSTRCLMFCGFIAIMFVVFSCSSMPGTPEETLLEKNWGRSYESARYLQMLDPDAGKNLNPVLGLDGNAASHNMDKYHEAFKEKEPKEIVNVLKLQ